MGDVVGDPVVGLTVGLSVGEIVGLTVGLVVGDIVGLAVGDIVGDLVGLTVGEVVGKVVGAAVVGVAVGGNVVRQHLSRHSAASSGLLQSAAGMAAQTAAL